MSSDLQKGLSEAEIDTLAQRLAANPNPEALSLEAVDGLFCALIASPRSVMPHEYLPVILGGTLGEAGMLGDLSAPRTPRACRSQDRPQRSLSLRQRQEVQALLRRS